MRAPVGRLLGVVIVLAGCGRGAPTPERAPESAAAPAAAADHDHGHGHDHDHPGAARDVSCTCAEARLHNGWCGGHAAGYVAGVRIPYADLFEVLDAHGHEIDPASMDCAECKAAIESDGLCPVHQWGFVGGQLYVSKLTWVMARGQPREPESITCATCRSHAAWPGWCEACGIGMTGNVSFDDRAVFDVAAAEFERLAAAVSTADRCETCAIRQMVDGRCPACGLTWKDGRARTGEH